jgi:hypothetical protein
MRGSELRSAFWMMAVSSALVTGCVAPIEQSDLIVGQASAPPSTSFTLAGVDSSTPIGTEAREEVRRALIAAGLHEDPAAPVRVDVGFAVARKTFQVALPDARPVPNDPQGIATCRRGQYVLSVAMIARDSGQVLFRGTATAHRCARSAHKALPLLANAALSGSPWTGRKD